MSTPELLPFDESHLPDAGRLLAERHRRHRTAEPPAVRPLRGPGYCAGGGRRRARHRRRLRRGRVPATAAWSATCSARPKPGADLGAQRLGRVRRARPSRRPRTLRDLYAAAAARWVDEGRTAHYVLVPAHDEALSARGSGSPSATSTRTPSATYRPGRLRPRRRVRRAPAAAPTSRPWPGSTWSCPATRRLAPTFSSGRAGTYEEAVAEWEEDFDDPDFATFVAERDGRVVGSAVGCRLEKSGSHAGPARPENAGFLGFAAVFPEARGLGAGRALGEAVLDWSRQQAARRAWSPTGGPPTCSSSRAWPALGFRPTFLRLHRLLGH